MIYIALGANIGERAAQLSDAIDEMGKMGVMVTKQSSVYETAPVGYIDQPSFYNMVVEVETHQSVTDLLDTLQQIERQLGRERLFKNGPRTIDLDILYYNGEDIQSEHLTVPHPRMQERAFVLAPLAEIAPELVVRGRTVASWLADLPMADRQDVVRLQLLTNLVK
ncbi:2-amino-4-hydroxy-6-hydroxymethyldihydropteridine diphosphokinase [Exiguobacterium sp. MMG028]|uniref:2-amino-4-hydroxy-6- hydroxymethyldihydropteridine diphosphokinase n=1 Tax=Exiguobacterium sp. MMG028 TaxID=3021979 RepID=UPI0022FE54DC|nr:2-amino-4-hydroxy-6-hydroxymethyldihydropteridine diphosphokinase [Exiguobacterium sp. MMG028]MDA5561893.1 2-amino-4-hydroxy-6-hydroxymethyldihydropteridine diphosphokinase [Exiguobacterium sp. MMG028]